MVEFPQLWDLLASRKDSYSVRYSTLKAHIAAGSDYHLGVDTPSDRPKDPETGLEAEVRYVQPYQARKYYVCPRCGGDIEPGKGHFVVVPLLYPDLRRHWHRHCWLQLPKKFKT